MQQSIAPMNDFSQVHSMSGLAHKALEAYAVPVASIKPLKQVYNNNFLITSHRGERFLLRICHPRRKVLESVQSELLWLQALNHDTNLIVPEPVHNRQMQYVTVIEDARLTQPRFCILYHWIWGRFLYRSLTPAHLFRVGELTAHLHHHAAHWDRPSGFTRRRVDNLFCLRQDSDDNFDERIAENAVKVVAAASTLQDGECVRTVISTVWAVLKNLGEFPESFGLIHGDIHQTNYLFQTGRVGLIDFDDCGFGHWLYDLAVTLYCLRDHPNFTGLRAAFLAGYRANRPLSVEQEAYLGTFMALRAIQDMLWIIEERDRIDLSAGWVEKLIKLLLELRLIVST